MRCLAETLFSRKNKKDLGGHMADTPKPKVKDMYIQGIDPYGVLNKSH
jgi:hypothetical protein